MAHEPEEIDAEGNEEVVERVAAIDVAKASGMVCIRLPHETVPGRRVTNVWQVASTTNAITALVDELAGQGIERVVVESTSDYWRPFVYLLEAQELNVWLVNAQEVKQVPGRPKTDKLDAVWLAKHAGRDDHRGRHASPRATSQSNSGRSRLSSLLSGCSAWGRPSAAARATSWLPTALSGCLQPVRTSRPPHR